MKKNVIDGGLKLYSHIGIVVDYGVNKLLLLLLLCLQVVVLPFFNKYIYIIKRF